jgi:hypothetical protein
MRWLLFLSRLAFICGICFLLSLSLLIKEWTKDQDLGATIITIGVFFGMLVVPVTLICYLIVIIRKKNLTAIVPLWLVISNIIFLIFLFIYIISINAHNYPQK